MSDAGHDESNEFTRRRFLVDSAGAGVGLTVGAGVSGNNRAHATAAARGARTYPVPELSSSAEILVDAWGVPHIYANEHYDAFVAQGFNAARDRLWQIDLWRRRGLGKLSAVLGSTYVEQDRANRLFLYRGSMYREWLAYGNDAKRIAQAYVAGVNSYIRLAKEDGELVPWEFDFLGYEPEFWEPEDVVRLRTHAIANNLSDEVDRACFVRDFGFDYEDIRRPLDVPWETSVPEGLDLNLLPQSRDELLEVYDLATSDVVFNKEDFQNVDFGSARVNGLPVEPDTDATSRTARSRGHDSSNTARRRSPRRHQDVGSNTWAVAPTRTATRGPLIASDPHRDQGVPSLRYIAHLNARGLNVIGAGEPGLPGVSLGHNENIAFGLTIFAIDQEDLYVYDTKPDDPSSYRYDGHWESMTVVTTEIEVKDGDPVTTELKFTRHGPVIYEDSDKHVAFAVRTVWSGPGTAAYFGSVEYMRARNWREFRSAINRWGTPSENQQYADTRGNIGWKPGGRAPVRPSSDGLLPVPGSNRYEWSGFYDMDQLPINFNPERGWLQTNNEMRLFDNFENGPEQEYVERKIGFEWSAPWRALRTREVLAEETGATLQSMLKLQTDHLSIPGRRISAHLEGLETDDERVQDALTLLLRWDHHMRNDSAAAALFDVWTGLHGAAGGGFLGQALLERAIKDSAAIKRIGSPYETALVDMVENPEKWLDGDAVAMRDEAVIYSLSEAVQAIYEDQGPNSTKWRYGLYNRQELNHPLSELVDERTRRNIDLGPRERDPVDNTVGDSGASWRYIAEPGNWDKTIAMSNPGQSGNPDSRFYDNLFQPWAEGKTFPLVFSRNAVEKNTVLRIRLVPDD